MLVVLNLNKEIYIRIELLFKFEIGTTSNIILLNSVAMVSPNCEKLS